MSRRRALPRNGNTRPINLIRCARGLFSNGLRQYFHHLQVVSLCRCSVGTPSCGLLVHGLEDTHPLGSRSKCHARALLRLRRGIEQLPDRARILARRHSWHPQPRRAWWRHPIGCRRCRPWWQRRSRAAAAGARRQLRARRQRHLRARRRRHLILRSPLRRRHLRPPSGPWWQHPWRRWHGGSGAGGLWALIPQAARTTATAVPRAPAGSSGAAEQPNIRRAAATISIPASELLRGVIVRHSCIPERRAAKPAEFSVCQPPFQEQSGQEVGYIVICAHGHAHVGARGQGGRRGDTLQQVGSNMDAEARKRTKQQIPPVQCHEQPCHEQPCHEHPHAAISSPPPNACQLACCIDPPPRARTQRARSAIDHARRCHACPWAALVGARRRGATIQLAATSWTPSPNTTCQ